MGRGGGAGPARGDGGSWLRTYDRVVAMVGKVEALVAGRAQLEAVNELQHEFWEDRGGVLQARFLQAEESRKKWEAAYMDLLPHDDHRKFAELQESDLEDFTTFIDLLTAENSELKIQLKEVRSCVEDKKNTTDHEQTARSLRAELRKLKEAHETLSSKKDKEVAALIAEKDLVQNQLRRKKEDY
ncbi:hypothetical protein BRADI_5g01744v3 [Brachypodium distachyon]|uniref:Uncharacterized protein n=1 Tax=Brachypodium distachyon TaxID=15368 RepID=A0A2K2CEW4_BRADI|nr:hypothetical protein BRADI_5g01744v3 [Brachypodium distachyon]